MFKRRLENAIVILAKKPDVESLYVRKKRGMTYEILSIPFFAYNVSRNDIVECSTDEDGEGLFVDHVVAKSGNRTVRVGFKCDEKLQHPGAVQFVNFLKEQHFDFETFPPRLLGVNLSSTEQYDRLVSRLSEVPPESKMIWEDGDPQPEMTMGGAPVPGGGAPS